MSEVIKKNLNFSTGDLNVPDTNALEVKNEISNKIKSVFVSSADTEEVDFDDDGGTGLASDFTEEIVGTGADRVSQTAALWLSNGKNLLASGIDISLTGAERISSAAFSALRALPVISLVVPPLWESFKYGVLEEEGPQSIINHKYEITGAAIGGVASGAVMATVLASNPAGWVTAGALGLCMVGSIALENLGAYYDNADTVPTDYLSGVYFY